MRPIATDAARGRVPLCLLVTFVRCRITDGGQTRVGPRKHVLDWVENGDPATERGILAVVWPIEKHWKSVLLRFYAAKHR